MSAKKGLNMSQGAQISRRYFLGGLGASALTLATGRQASANMSLAEYFWPKSDGPDFSHAAWSALLKKYLVEGPDKLNLLRYNAMRADRGALKAYLAELAQARPSGLGRASSASFWINLYNALTVDVILEHYPVNSIRDIKLRGNGLLGSGPWKEKLITIESKALSLDDIEHGILRPTLGDPKVHYTVNCASVSCPSLQPSAYSRGNLGRYMRKGARDYINSNRGVRIEGRQIVASSIYDWYVNDFGGKSKLKSHWLIYASNSKSDAIVPARISSYVYDWSLNDAG